MRPLRRVDFACLLSFFLPPAEPVPVRCGRPGGGVIGEEAAVGSGGGGGHGEWIQTGCRAQTLLPTGFNTTNPSLRHFMSHASKSLIMCKHRALRFIWSRNFDHQQLNHLLHSVVEAAPQDCGSEDAVRGQELELPASTRCRVGQSGAQLVGSVLGTADAGDGEQDPEG